MHSENIENANRALNITKLKFFCRFAEKKCRLLFSLSRCRGRFIIFFKRSLEKELVYLQY